MFFDKKAIARTLAIVIVVVIVVAAVGGGLGFYYATRGPPTPTPTPTVTPTPTPTPTPTGTPTPTPPEEQPPDKIYLAYDFAACETPFFVAIKNDLFAKKGLEGVEFEIFPCESVAELREAIHSGKASFGFTAYEFYPVVDSMGDFYYLNGLHTGCIVSAVSNDLWDAGVRDEASFIQWVKEGVDSGERRKINVGQYGNSPFWWLSVILSQNGLDIRSDVEITVTDPAAVPAAMAAGKMDCAFEWDPIPRIVEWEGAGHILLDSGTDEPWSNYHCCFLGANKEFYEQYPETTKKILEAVEEAALYVTYYPQEAAQDYISFGPELVPYVEEELIEMYAHYRYDVANDANMEINTFRAYWNQLYDMGFVVHDVDWAIENGYRHIDGVQLEGLLTDGKTFEAPTPTPTPTELYDVNVMWAGATCEIPQMLLAYDHHDIGEKYGLNIIPIGYTTIASYKEGLDTGKIHFGAGPTYLLTAIEQGMNIKYTMAYHSGCIDLVVAPDAVGTWYNTPADLKGKTIAVGDFGDSPMYSLIKILDYYGLNSRTDVDIVVIPYPDMPRVLEEGQIDAFISWEPVPLLAEQMGVGTIVVNTALEAPFNEITCCYLAVSGEVPDWVATAITEAFTEEMFWVMNNKAEAVQMVLDRKLLLGDFDMVYEELSWLTYYPRDPMVDLVDQADLLYNYGYLGISGEEVARRSVWEPAGLDLSELQQAYDWPATW